MIFHSWKQSTCNLFTHEIWRLANLFGILTVFRPLSLKFLQIVLCFILGLVLFHKKEVCVVSKALIMWIGTVDIRAWRIIFDIAKFLKTTFLLSRVRFWNRQSFSTVAHLKLLWESYILLLSCCYMRSKCLEF